MSKAKVTAFVVVSIMLGAYAYARKGVRDRRRVQEYVTAREVIGEQLRVALSHREVLKMSARLQTREPGNTLLAACVLGGECRVTDPEHPQAFIVRSGMSPEAPILAGTDATPAFYGAHGQLGCSDEKDDECPGWRARAWFWAECEGGAPSCQNPQAIRVLHQIEGVGALAGLPASPDKGTLAKAARYLASEVKLVR